MTLVSVATNAAGHDA